MAPLKDPLSRILGNESQDSHLRRIYGNWKKMVENPIMFDKNLGIIFSQKNSCRSARFPFPDGFFRKSNQARHKNHGGFVSIETNESYLELSTPEDFLQLREY